jgi:catechol 2,3-dioxygenase-like lactoylglutathione lyase family enzyme
MKLSVKSIAIVSNDLGASERFYVDGLGLRVAAREAGRLRLDAGGTQIMLHKPWKPGWQLKDESVFVAFHVENLDQYFALLVGKGIAKDENRGVFEGGAETIRLRDPDGHTISIVEK